MLVLGTIDAGAPAGDPGTILIDPVNLTIVAEGDTIPGAGQAALTGNVLGEAAPPDEAYLWPSQFQNLTGDVILQASNDIAVNAAIDRNGGALSLEAGRDIAVNAPISGTGSLALTAGRDIATGAAIQLAGTITLDAGRNLVIDGPLTAQGTEAVTLFARSGSISFTTGQITGNGGTFAATAATDVTSDTFMTGFNGMSLTAQAGDVALTTTAVLFNGEGGPGVSIVAGNAILLNGGERSGGVVISTTDLVDLQAGVGGISQTAAVRAGTLQVRTTGDAILDLAPAVPSAAINQVGTLAASDVAGNFSLRATELGDIAAPLVITDLVRVGGRFSLEALTSVSQAAPSAIVTPDMTVTSPGAIQLLGDNAIATLSGVTGGAFGNIDIRNVTDLAVTGPVTLTTPNFVAGISITVVGGDLTIAAPVIATAQEGLGVVALSATGNLVVTTAGSVTAEGPLSGSINLTAASDGFGSVDPSLPGRIALAGNVNAEGGVVSLAAGLGGIVQTAGGITTDSLYVASAGDALLSSPSNAVAALASIGVAGTFLLDNGLNDLLVRTGPPTESTGEAGSIGLRTGGAVTLIEGSQLIATDEAGRISFRVGALVGEDQATAIASLIEIAPFVATPMRLPLTEPLPGVFSITPDTLARLSFQSLRLGATTFGDVMTTTADGLSIAATLTVPALLDLRSLAGITQDAGAGIVAATLTGASGGSTVLTDPGNLVATLAGFNAGGDFDFFTQGPLLTVPRGSTVFAGGALTIEVAGGGLLVDGTVTGGTTSLLADRTLAVNGFSAIARNGSLLLQAPEVSLNGLAEAAGDIVVEAEISASLAGFARTTNALSIVSPSVTFGGLDARTADVRINLGAAGFTSGALDAGGLLVQGGRGAVLTGSIATITGPSAAAQGRRATPGGVLLPDPPPDLNSYTFNDCPIGAAACAAIPPPPPPLPPAPPGCLFGTLPCAAIPLTLLNPAALLAVLDPAQILDAVDQLRPPTPDLALQPTRDATEDSELAPPDIRGGDY